MLITSQKVRAYRSSELRGDVYAEGDLETVLT